MPACDVILYLSSLESKCCDDSFIRHSAREAWELLHSGYYQDVSIDTRLSFDRISAITIQSCTSAFTRQYFLDRTYILHASTTLDSDMSPHELNVHEITTKHLTWNTNVSLELIRTSDNFEILESSASIESIARMLLIGKPFLIRGGCSSWSAISAWRDPQFWLRTYPNRFVPVEVGSYTDDLFIQGIVSLVDFVKFIGSVESTDSPQVYLAQHDIFELFPNLSEHVSPTPDLFHAVGASSRRDIFFGPSGTVTQLHRDPYSNLFCQVVGFKYIKLHDPKDSEMLYLVPGSNSTNLPHDMFSVTREYLLSKFPLYRSDLVYECTILPGDCIYIPEGWWHSLKSASVSCSIAHFVNT